MKKLLSVVAASALLVSALAGCGQNRVGRIFSALSHHRTCRSAYGGSIQFQNMSPTIVVVDTAH